MTCIYCGGNAYTPYAYGCDHWDGSAPEPAVVRESQRVSLEYVCEALAAFARYDYRSGQLWMDRAGRPEMGAEDCWVAVGDCEGEQLSRRHPTREGAIAAWKEAWTWGRFVGALFRTLTEWSSEGARRLEARQVIGEYVRAGDEPNTAYVSIGVDLGNLGNLGGDETFVYWKRPQTTNLSWFLQGWEPANVHLPVRCEMVEDETWSARFLRELDRDERGPA